MDHKTLSMLFSNSSTPTAVIDKFNRIIIANPAMLNIWEKDPVVMNKVYQQSLSMKWVTELDIYIPRVETSLQNCVHEQFNVHNDNQDRAHASYYDIVYTPIMDHGKEFQGVLILANDVTQQMGHLNKLSRESDRCLTAMKAAQLGIFDQDLSTGEIIWDERSRKLFGINEHKPVYMPDFIEALPPKERQAVIAQLEAAKIMAANQPEFSLEYRVTGIDKFKERWLKMSGIIRSDEHGKATGIIGTVQDISLDKKQHELKNNFIGMVSHELKTPLTSLKAYLQLMRNNRATNQEDLQHIFLSKADQQIGKMMEIMSGFLSVARLESGRLYLHRANLDLSALLQTTVGDQQDLFPSHHIKFKGASGLVVYADEEKILQVFTNLISNAVKFSPFSQIIQVTCKALSDRVAVTVEDYGIGIEASELPLIFNRFHRTTNGVNKHISGFGIGLYLCAELLRLHQGEIWAESEPGRGTTITFTLPIQKQE